MPDRMSTFRGDAAASGFHTLVPDTVIDLVERALGRRLTSLCRPLNSYINRVYELQDDDGVGVIAKFYRPGRWSYRALQDEHDFLFELDELEIPVVAPLRSVDGQSLHQHDGYYFVLFPKKLGRGLDEPTMEQWEELGRLMARVHLVGATRKPKDRMTMHPRYSTREHLDYILTRDVVPRDMRNRYRDVVESMIELIAPMFDSVEMLRIHGDCHAANLVYRPGESFTLIDFDDMVTGPPIQDLWMLLPEYGVASLVEIDLFLDGYTTFRAFDRRMLKLIEPLRAMRFIHFSAWCAMQAADGGFTRLAPDWGSTTYWKNEINDLEQQKGEIVSSQTAFWGM
jgi:Ser/Thr protein kinase RdoA (MazF antagonist)